MVHNSKTRKENQQEILLKIGKKVKFYREQKGLSQYDLAIDAKITENQIGRIERAEINTSILALYSIAKALKINVKDLLA